MLASPGRPLRLVPFAMLGALLACSCDTAPSPTTSAGAGSQRTTAPGGEPPSLATPRVVLHEPGVENAYPRPSRDGSRIVYQSNRTGRWQLFVMDVAAGAQTRLTNGSWDDNFVDWSADEQWIAFVSNRDGNEELYRMRADGTGVERLTDDPARDIHPYFSPDGAFLLFNSTRGNGSLDVYRLVLADRTVQRLTATALHETCARYAPDMRSFVMLQNGATQDDLLLVDSASGEARNLTNTPLVRDGWPAFSADGAWIYYSSMAGGQHRVHRVRPDGTDGQQLTDGGDGIEDGRAVVSADGTTLVWNRRRPDGIDILLAKLPS
jgi:TolB protein